MIRTLLTTLLLFTMAEGLNAQDFAFGQVSAEDLNMTRYAKDTSAHAVVLQEFGKSRINVGNDDNIKLYFDYHVKIKIFDSKGFDEATAEIKLRNTSDNDQADEVFDISGATYF